jgi:hypothetical protein
VGIVKAKDRHVARITTGNNLKIGCIIIEGNLIERVVFVRVHFHEQGLRQFHQTLF